MKIVEGFCDPFHVAARGKAHEVEGEELEFHGKSIKVFFLVFI